MIPEKERPLPRFSRDLVSRVRAATHAVDRWLDDRPPALLPRPVPQRGRTTRDEAQPLTKYRLVRGAVQTFFPPRDPQESLAA